MLTKNVDEKILETLKESVVTFFKNIETFLIS
jgi:hypothetical protein